MDIKKKELHNIIEDFGNTIKCDDIIEEAQHKWVYLSNIIQHKVSFYLRHICPGVTKLEWTEIDRFI